MTVELVAVIVSVVSLLLGGGIVTRIIAHNTKQAVLEDRQERFKEDLKKNTDAIALLSTQQALTSLTVEGIGKKLEKLDLLEVVHTNVTHLLETTANMLPRPEADAKFASVEGKVETLEKVVYHHQQS